MSKNNSNNFENNFLNNLDYSLKERQKPDDVLFDGVLLKSLKRRFEERFGDTRPNPKDFINIYDIYDVVNDNNKVKELKSEYSAANSVSLEQKKLIGDVFERIIIEESMKSAWLGREAKVVPTSHYDDYVNGVDVLAEIHSQKEGGQHLGLAIDVTLSKNEDSIIKKLDNIKNQIIKGNAPAKVKYFVGKNGPQTTIYVPKVIVGADSDTVRDLVKITEKKASSDERVWKQAEHDLNFHPFQTKMLLEIQAQLAAFMNLAFSVGNDRTGKAYFKANKIIESIIQEKTLFREQKKSSEVMGDGVVQTILDYTRNLK